MFYVQHGWKSRKAWGKEKVFREGQAEQTLDDLVFVYCDTIAKLKPKVFLLENVKGIIQGNAKWYSKEIVRRMEANGYAVQVFCLNAASMGVPQKRERVFFIGYRKELGLPKLRLAFDERAIFISHINPDFEKKKTFYTMFEGMAKDGSRPTYDCNRVVSKTITGTSGGVDVFDAVTEGAFIGGVGYSKTDLVQIGTYPLDYDFQDIEPKYLIGMSVPSVMMAQIANQIWGQWLSKIK